MLGHRRLPGSRPSGQSGATAKRASNCPCYLLSTCCIPSIGVLLSRGPGTSMAYVFRRRSPLRHIARSCERRRGHRRRRTGGRRGLAGAGACAADSPCSTLPTSAPAPARRTHLRVCTNCVVARAADRADGPERLRGALLAASGVRVGGPRHARRPSDPDGPRLAEGRPVVVDDVEAAAGAPRPRGE